MMCHSCYSPTSPLFTLPGVIYFFPPFPAQTTMGGTCVCSHADTALKKAVSCTTRMNKPKEGIKPQIHPWALGSNAADSHFSQHWGGRRGCGKSLSPVPTMPGMGLKAERTQLQAFVPYTVPSAM